MTDKNSHKAYLIYIDIKDDSEKEDNLKKIEENLKNIWGENNYHRINSSNNFIIKVSSQVPLSQILEKAELSEEGQKRGFVIEFIPGCFNGWYSPGLWDFIRLPIIDKKTDNEDLESNDTK